VGPALCGAVAVINYHVETPSAAWVP
jgi:hypothetical protein